jgi:hypothetical protein
MVDKMSRYCILFVFLLVVKALTAQIKNTDLSGHWELQSITENGKTIPDQSGVSFIIFDDSIFIEKSMEESEAYVI